MSFWKPKPMEQRLKEAKEERARVAQEAIEYGKKARKEQELQRVKADIRREKGYITREKYRPSIEAAQKVYAGAKRIGKPVYKFVEKSAEDTAKGIRKRGGFGSMQEPSIFNGGMYADEGGSYRAKRRITKARKRTRKRRKSYPRRPRDPVGLGELPF